MQDSARRAVLRVDFFLITALVAFTASITPFPRFYAPLFTTMPRVFISLSLFGCNKSKKSCTPSTPASPTRTTAPTAYTLGDSLLDLKLDARSAPTYTPPSPSSSSSSHERPPPSYSSGVEEDLIVLGVEAVEREKSMGHGIPAEEQEEACRRARNAKLLEKRKKMLEEDKRMSDALKAVGF